MQSPSQIFQSQKWLSRGAATTLAGAFIGIFVPSQVVCAQTQPAQNAQQAFLQAASPAPAVAAGAKKSGVVRIGVVAPKAALGSGANAFDVSQSLQNALVRYLSGPSAEITPIMAMLPQQIEAEVKDKNCDFVLYTGLTQKQGKMGLFKAAASMASMVPMVGMAAGAAGAMAGMAGGSALGGIANATNGLKAKSDIAFDYKLTATGTNATIIAETLNAKVKTDGEDVVSPLIERAATTILAKLAAKPEVTNPSPK